jgi:hypothetical protein
VGDLMSRPALLGVWLLIVVMLPFAALRMLWAVVATPDRAQAQARAFDRAGNALANGSEHELISERAYRALLENRRWGCRLCKLLDFFDKDHCKKNAN